MTQNDTRPPAPPSNNLVDVWRGMRKPVFIPASITIFGLIIFAVVYGVVAEDAGAFVTLRDWIGDGVGWWYIAATTFFILFVVYCAFSKIGNIRLGRDDEVPEFGLLPWFAMLFSAGMGIGLVFYGVAEPLMHYLSPPAAGGLEPGTDAAANQAMELTLFHWGLHAWAIYVVVGLGLAYMTFRRKRPLAVRWLLEPLFGRKVIEGWVGHTIDTVAIVGTLFGVATSLGFGVQQILGGLQYLGWVESSSSFVIIAAVAAVTAFAAFSVISGVHRGMKWLSNINITLAALLALFVFVTGATLLLLNSWIHNIGGYIQALPELMLRTAPFAEDSWLNDWTVFYWGWWISWAPFVGMFIARISRGRTVREFVGGVLLAPTLVSTIWFTVFGDSAILRQREHGDLVAEGGSVNANTSLFQLLDTLPLATITSVLAIVIVTLFFVTSSDSGSLVIDILGNGGQIETPRVTRLYWCVLEGVAAAALLIVGGSASLVTLQTASIATAVPFSIVMVLACLSLWRAFRYEVATTPTYWHATPVTDGRRAPSSTLPVGHPLRNLRKVSATLAGFSATAARPTVPAADNTSLVLAVHQVQSCDLVVDPDTGTVRVNGSSAPTDPLEERDEDGEVREDTADKDPLPRQRAPGPPAARAGPGLRTPGRRLIY